MKKLMTCIFIVAMLLSLSGCKKQKATITTTVYPVTYLVEYLAGDKVNVQYISTDDFIARSNLVDNYQQILENTTLFIYIDSLESYLDINEDILEKYQFDVIDLADLSAINSFKKYVIIETSTKPIIQETDYYKNELFADIDLYKKDPYIWLDPIAMSSMAATIKQWLQTNYPEDALVFENNFKKLQTSLVRLDAEYQELNELGIKKMVTVAPTFGNWQKVYNFDVYPLILSKYGVLPSSEQLDYIKKVIKENKVKYIAYDETLSDDMLELYNQVKKELGLIEIKLSSLSRLSANDLQKDKDYLTIMLENLTALEKAFKVEVN